MYNQFLQFCPKFDALEVKNGIYRLIFIDFSQNRGIPPQYERCIHLYCCTVFTDMYCTYLILLVFVRNGILSIADYNFTLMGDLGVVVVDVVAYFFMMAQLENALSYQVDFSHGE